MSSTRQMPVAIVGVACRFPGAPDETAYWNVIATGSNTVSVVPPSRWEVEPLFDPKPGTVGKMSTRYGGFIDRFDKFDADFFGINPREARIADPQQRVMLELAWQAIEDAGADPRSWAGTRCGVYLGVSTWDYNKIINRDLSILDAYVGPGSSLSILANRISYQLDLKGPSMAVDTACSSSLVALHLAAQSLAVGESDCALVGGVNLMLSPETHITFSVAGFMSPVGRCKTFAADADGYVRSEGAAVLVLKRYEDALRDGDVIRGILRGSAVNQDGATNGLTSPNGTSQQQVIREALRKAGVRPAEIEYVELHGTGTPLGDPIEVRALASVLREGRAAEQPCRLGAVKANIGHCEAAAGMAGVIKVLLAWERGVLPGQPSFGAVNPHVASVINGSPIEIARESAPWNEGPRLAGVSSFGFGGVNAHVVLESAPKGELGERGWEGPHVLKLCAESPAAMRQLAGAYLAALQPLADDAAACADFCRSANCGRSDFRFRRVLIASSGRALCAELQRERAARRHVSARKRAKLALVFPATATDPLASARALYDTERVFRTAFDACAALLDSPLQASLIQLMQHGSERCAGALADVALFALEYALAELLSAWGLRPGIVYGEGVGEYVACCVAGMLSLADALRLVIARAGLPRAGASDVALGEPFMSTLVGVTLRAPTLKLIGSVDGALADEKSFSAAYFARQLAGELARPAALVSLTAGGASVLLEAGARGLLEELTQHAPAGLTLIAGLEPEGSRAQAHPALAEAYGAGLDVAWQVVNPAAGRRRVRVPSYPFQGRRHWVEFSPKPISMAPAVLQRPVPAMVETLEPAARCYRQAWIEKARGAPASATGRWLVLERATGTLGAPLVAELRARGIHAQLVASEQSQGWQIPAGEGAVTRVIELRASSTRNTGDDRCAACEDAISTVLDTVHTLLREPALLRARLWLVTRDAQAVTSASAVDCFQSPLWGFGRTLELELPTRWGGIVDSSGADQERPAQLAQQLAAELQCSDGESQVALRGHGRFVPRLVPGPSLPASGGGLISPYGSYLVTGGLGQLGTRVLRFLADAGAKFIVVTAHSQREHEPEILDELHARGITVEVLRADTRDRSAMEAAVNAAGALAPLRGVVHAAGLRKDCAVARLDRSGLSSVLRPKADGAWLLHELTRDEALDFFVMFSSVAAALGSPGQTNYAAANAFLDGLAHLRHSLQLPALSLQWGPWGGGGMVSELDEVGRKRMAARGLRLLEPGAAMLTFARALGSREPTLAVIDMEPAQFVSALPSGRRYAYFTELTAADPTGVPALEPQETSTEADVIELADHALEPAVAANTRSAAEESAPRTSASRSDRARLAPLTADEQHKEILALLVGMFAKTLGMAESDIVTDADMDDQGMDSLLYMEILLELEERLELTLSPVELSAHTRLDRLAEYLRAQLGAQPRATQAPVQPTGAAQPAVAEGASERRDLVRAPDVSAPIVSLDVEKEDDSEATAGSGRERTFVARGRKLAYLEWGPSDALPVVMIHGILDQALAWDLVAQQLADRGHRIIAPDLRGHGLSAHDDRSEGYSLLSFCADLADMVEHLELDRFVLAGHSLGSLVSVVYASCFPRRVAGLVLLETIILAGLDKADIREHLRQDIEYMRGDHSHRNIPSLEMAVKLIRQGSPGLTPSLARRLCERGTRPAGTELTWRWDPILRTRVGLRFPGMRAQYLQMLREIAAPVRLVFGRQSNFNRAEDVDQLLAAFPQCGAEYVEGGHNVHFDNPNAIVSEVHSMVHRVGADDAVRPFATATEVAS